AIPSRATLPAPSSRASCSSLGPLSSSPPPAAFEVLIVRTAARTCSLRPAVIAAPAALLEQHDVLQLDTLLDALDHVVHGERGHCARGQSLHLDPRARERSGLACELDQPRRDVHACCHVD